MFVSIPCHGMMPATLQKQCAGEVRTSPQASFMLHRSPQLRSYAASHVCCTVCLGPKPTSSVGRGIHIRSKPTDALQSSCVESMEPLDGGGSSAFSDATIKRTPRHSWQTTDSSGRTIEPLARPHPTLMEGVAAQSTHSR